MKLTFSIIALLFFFLTPLNAAELKTSDVNWSKEKISKVYDEKSKKLIFLVQFTKNAPLLSEYEYDMLILTLERKRTCDGNFISTSNAIYFTCSVKIDDPKTVDDIISLQLVVEDPLNNDDSLEINRSYNNIKTTPDIAEKEPVIVEEIPKVTIDKNIEKKEKVSLTGPSTKLNKTEEKVTQILEKFFTSAEKKFSPEKIVQVIATLLEQLSKYQTSHSHNQEILSFIEKTLLEKKSFYEMKIVNL